LRDIKGEVGKEERRNSTVTSTERGKGLILLGREKRGRRSPLVCWESEVEGEAGAGLGRGIWNLRGGESGAAGKVGINKDL